MVRSINNLIFLIFILVHFWYVGKTSGKVYFFSTGITNGKKY